MDYTAKDAIKPRDGFATFEGRRYILVDARYLPDPKEEGKSINAVAETATEVSPGYFPMVLRSFRMESTTISCANRRA